MSQEIKYESPLDTSITSSNSSSIVQDDDEDEKIVTTRTTTNIPWQYHWKRLSFAQIQSNLNNPMNSTLLKDKVPIQTVSARLNAEEIKQITKVPMSSAQCPSQDTPKNEDLNLMSWEELESSSEEEYEIHVNVEEDIGHVVSITTLVSKSFLQHLQHDCLQDDHMNQSSHDGITVPADTILIEVIKDVYWKKDSNDSVSSMGGMDYHGGADMDDTVEVVQRKVLYWPKALTNHETYLHTQQSQSKWNPIQSIQQMIHNIMAWKGQRTSEDDPTQENTHRRRKQRYKDIQKRNGVTDITLVRSQPTKYNDKIGTVDVDEIVDLLVQLNLGIDSQVDAERIAMMVQQNEQSSNDLYHRNSIADMEADGDLLLSCICNDGNIQLFSVLDLLKDWNHDLNDNQPMRSVVDVICGNDKEHETFLSQFESFIIGKDMLSSLQKSVLPLSTPIATIPLTIYYANDERMSQQESKQSRKTLMEQPQLKKLEDLAMIYDDHQPHMDFSTIDSTLEPSTLSDKTFNNVATVTCAAFGYIAVAGHGLRRIRRYEHLDQSSKTKSEVQTVPGGFVTLLSTTYHSESRTIFVPFEPMLMRPVYWNNMQLLILCGKTTHECVCIRVDPSSFVSFEQKSIRDHVNFGYNRFRTRQEHYYIRKFVPIQINLHSDLDISMGQFIPLSITDIYCDPPSIITCSKSNEKLNIRKITLESFNVQKSNRFPNSQGTISTHWDHRKFVALDLFTKYDLNVCEIDITKQIRMKHIWCISGQGWSFLNFYIGSKYKLFSIIWDGSSKDRGSFYTQMLNMNRSNESLLDCISNLKPNGLIEQCHFSFLLQDYQVSVGYIREYNPHFNAQLSLRSNICSNVISSPFEEILEWLCSRRNYQIAACIALSLLDDKEGLFDLHGDNANAYEDKESPFEAFLDGITPPTRNTETLIKISNIAITCLVHGGPLMTHTLDKFLGRNEYYDSSVACQILVDCIVNTISDLNASDMTHLAPFSYNPLVSQGHSLWPVQCLLRVAVSKDCMKTALDLLNQNIPDILRHRCLKVQEDSHSNSYLSSLSLSKSIISMILAASKDSARYLMEMVEEGTSKFFWDSLDHETRLCLSLLFVQGKYPLLREVDVREWVLDLLHQATGLLKKSDYNYNNDSLSSDFLRGICSGVTCNAGCDLSQTTFMTTDLVQNISTNISQEKEEALFDYITKSSQESGGLDYDLLIPSLLLLEKRETFLFPNQNISVQSILNVACDLAGRPIVKEEKFTTNLSELMKQTVLMENPLAAANLIGGVNGMVLKCANALVIETGITILEAENYLLRSKVNGEHPTAFNSLAGTRADDFELTEGHEIILSLIEKHVLSVRKFGAFAQSNSRGHVNPVIAAHICFKAWIYLAQRFPQSGPWIEKWLTDRLNLDIDSNSSNLRLPSAALIRALLWDEVSTDAKEEATLSNIGLCLGFSTSFLIRLARSSCGLLESVPPSVANDPTLK